MPEILSQKSLEHLAKLARIEINAREEEKLLKDLQGILNYFEELKNLDMSEAENSSGGEVKNSLRQDGETRNTDRGKGREAFPQVRKNFLRVPPVFEE
jgi:aspartyl-tRNA(Asn)/glutamyl-tRNA(Gln) amidotransferase subunit C